MRHLGVSLMGWGLLASLMLCAAILAPAEDGRDFYAFYDTTDILDLGDQVGMTFTLELYNVSRADVANATVTREDPAQPGASFGIFTAVSVAYRDRVRLSSSITVPCSEYDSWQQGTPPSLRIDFSDAGGNIVERPIEVGWEPLPQEEN